MKRQVNRLRTTLLHGAGTAALASLIVTGAHAGETVISPAPSPTFATGTAEGHAVINGMQQNAGSSSASIIESTITSSVSGPANAISVTVDGNEMKASAAGTDFTNTIDLSVVPETPGAGDGAASLNFSVNFGPVWTDVSGNRIGANYTDLTHGTVSVADSTISSTATGNNGSTVLSGTILPAYASSAVGSSSLLGNSTTADDMLNATGSLVASTAQFQLGEIYTRAYSSYNAIGLGILNESEDLEIDASLELADNTIDITASGNSSNSTIDIQPGGAATFAGSAVITNGQLNGGTAPGSEIVAINDDSWIEAWIAADEDYTYDHAELRGSLSVTGNAITATVSGNKALGNTADQAGNRILLADGASFSGSGDAIPGTSITYDEGEMAGNVTADLVIQSSQGNSGASSEDRLAIRAQSYYAYLGAGVAEIDGGSVTVSDNEIVTTANGNTASSAIASGDNMPLFAGAAALANQQVNYDINVYAVSDGYIYADVARDSEMDDSTASVTDNTVRAAAFGSSSSQSIAIDAATMDLPVNRTGLSGGTGGGIYSHGNLAATGSVTVANLQGNYNTDVEANDYHWIEFDGAEYGAHSSTIEVKGNVAEAVAAGASAASALALSGVSVGTGAGIVSLQVNDDSDGIDDYDPDIRASSWGYILLDVDSSAESSTLELTGNLQRAIAYGGTAANGLGIDAETITVASSDNGYASLVQYDDDASGGRVLTRTDQPEVTAAYGLLNVQSLNGDVGARAGGWYSDEPPIEVEVDGDVESSSVVNGGNAMVAAAYGADAVNATGLAVGTLDTPEGDFVTVMNLTNVQETTYASSVSAQAGGHSAIGTYIYGDVDGSTVSTSLNTVQALAYANRAANTVAVSGTNIDTAADTLTNHGKVSTGPGGMLTDASFSLSNAQVAGGEIAATFLDYFDPDDAEDSTSIRTYIGNDVNGSTVASTGNTLSSGATGNRADNLLDLAGNSLATTSALANLQIVSEDTEITSRSGTASGFDEVMTDPGTDDQEPEEFTFSITGTGLGHSDGAFDEGTLYVDVSTLTEAQIAALEEDGWEPAEGTEYSRSAVGFAATIDEYGTLSGGGSVERTDYSVFVPGTPPIYDYVFVPGTGGVFLTIGGDISGSTLSVNGNTNAGSATGNSASNALKVAANGIEDGNASQLSFAEVYVGMSVNADHALSNTQAVEGDGTELVSNVYGTFAIDAENGMPIMASTLSVDGNSQSSRAVANTADNRVEFDAGNTNAGTALASSQSGWADVVATSDMEISAPVASGGSHVSLSDNTNLALAVQNNVSNTLIVEATNTPLATSEAIVGFGAGVHAQGDHVLLNQQYAAERVLADAVTSISNKETDTTSYGVYDGSVTVSGNTTMAEASANRAVNVASVSATSALTATTGVANMQVSEATVSAYAEAEVGIMLAGDDDVPAAALNGSSVTVAGNVTTALARGNVATNVLNYAAGASYGLGSPSPASADSSSAAAQAAVLNSQVNLESVSANVGYTMYGAALNSGGGIATAIGASVQVSGNTMAAAAYGNNASNTLVLTSLNTSQPTAALANTQVNTGSVSASVQTATYGTMASGGSVSGSSAMVAANQVTANAVGNSAVNTIAAR